MKFSKKFESDYNWYLYLLSKGFFNFDGVENYYNKNGVDLIQPSIDGLTAKECFYLYDSQGIIKETKDPDGYKKLLKTKGSINLHIKMYAEDRARGYLPKIEFDIICEEYNVPEWFVKAVENQKKKYLPEWAKQYC